MKKASHQIRSSPRRRRREKLSIRFSCWNRFHRLFVVLASGRGTRGLGPANAHPFHEGPPSPDQWSQSMRKTAKVIADAFLSGGMLISRIDMNK